MKKLLSIISIIVAGVGLSHAQVGIGTDNPQGALDLNPDNGTAKWGLVLPIVPSADTVRYGTGVNDFYPSVTTPASTFRIIPIPDGEGGSTDMLVPQEEAPAGTIVFDAGRDGIRVKRSSGVANAPNGDWCADKIADSTSQVNGVIETVYGGADFKMTDVSAGDYYSIAINSQDRSVYAIGQNNNYKTGLGTRNTGNTTTWTQILGNAGPAKQVSAGLSHALAVMESGDVYIWGSNANGKTGRGLDARGRAITSGSTMFPTLITIPNLAAGDKVIQAEAGNRNSMFLTAQGKVYVTGAAGYRVLGNGTTSPDISTPALINFPGLAEGETIIQISLAPRSAAAVTSQGRVYTWGINDNYRTGQGTNSNAAANNTSTPKLITFPAGIKIIKVVMGLGSGLAMSDDGLHLYHWGNRSSLGQGTSTNNTPTEVTSSLPLSTAEGEKIVAIATTRIYDSYGGNYDCDLVLTTKSVYASGSSLTPGRLGVVNNSGATLGTVPAFTEIQNHAIYENSQFTGASIGYYHSFIITGEMKKADGTPDESKVYQNYTAYGTGRNGNYQLGVGPTGGWRFFTVVKK